MELVTNGEQLVAAMGYWPSFHDANVVEVFRANNSFSAKIHVFEMTDKVDPKGYFVLQKHHLVTFSFNGVQSNSLPGGYTTDCLDELVFAKVGDNVQVSFESVMGQSGEVVCTEVAITGVVPCSSTGSART